MAYQGNYKNAKGKRLASVTTILKQLGWSTNALMLWQARLFRAGKDPDKVKDEAADIGTVCHEMIEHYIYGQDEYTPPENTDQDTVITAAKGLKDYIAWSEAEGVEYLESEIRLVSEEYQYGGTADAIIKYHGKTYLIDFKTSKSLYDTYPVQLAAYRNAIHETTGYKIDGCMIIKIDKGEIEEGASRIKAYEIPNEVIDTGWETFKTCLQIKKYQSDIGKGIRKIIKEYDAKNGGE